MENLPLKSEADYRTALKEVDALMATELDTREGRLLDILVTLVEAYEHEQQIVALRFRRDVVGPQPSVAAAAAASVVTPLKSWRRGSESNRRTRLCRA
jgi:hypothetical protein